MPRSYVTGTWQKNRAFSPAVTTTGGRIVWLAGHGGQVDDNGKSLAGNFEAQVTQCFKNIERSLKEAVPTAKLADLVTMTVFILDVRNGDRFIEMRRALFGKDFPASALITVRGFANTEMMIEIQSVAVIE
jgi:enamine deaminase RidA (YjgF/YER057c/UK114 family)